MRKEKTHEKISHIIALLEEDIWRITQFCSTVKSCQKWHSCVYAKLTMISNGDSASGRRGWIVGGFALHITEPPIQLPPPPLPYANCTIWTFFLPVWFLVWPSLQNVPFSFQKNFQWIKSNDSPLYGEQLSADIECITDAKQKGCDVKDGQIRSGRQRHKVRGVTFSHCISPWKREHICKRFKYV